MNIFFMGTPEFAVPTLDILNKKYNVIGVFTQPPRPSGRGMKEVKSSIQEYSEKNKLNFYTPNNLKNDETLKLLDKLDEITLKYKGRFYLAKDARMKKEVFKKSDKRIKDYIKFRNQNDCDKIFISSQSSRLEL